MTSCYLASAVLAALCFYLAVPHQHLLPAMARHAAKLRVVAWILSAVSVTTAAWAAGFWAGLFAALTAFMLGCVLLPYVDAWRNAGRRASHVD